MDDLRLHGHVQRRGRLVGDEQRRVHDQGHGDGGALAHAAGEMVWVLVDPLFRIGNADPAHHVDGDAALVGGVGVGAPVLDVGHLPGVGHDRDLRRHRVLEDHGHLFAAVAVQFVFL